MKSFTRKDVPPTPPDDPGNPTVNCRGERRSNETHASTTHPDARLAHKGKLFYTEHVLLVRVRNLAMSAA